jgi:hypothetical protein
MARRKRYGIVKHSKRGPVKRIDMAVRVGAVRRQSGGYDAVACVGSPRGGWRQSRTSYHRCGSNVSPSKSPTTAIKAALRSLTKKLK